jgi:hypothetical protein
MVTALVVALMIGLAVEGVAGMISRRKAGESGEVPIWVKYP